jgi:hypothetical protein
LFELEPECPLQKFKKTYMTLFDKKKKNSVLKKTLVWIRIGS